jgi:peptidyl-prolyl cis-trans isomerase A (cyclophilin A)
VKRAWLLSCLLLTGCGVSGPEAMLRELESANESAAGAIAKAKDVDEVKEALAGRDKKMKEAFSKAKKLSREERESLEDRLVAKGIPGSEAIDKALMEFQGTSNPTVLISTSMGDVTVELYNKLAPVTVTNFLDYVDAQFYDGKIFHRVIPDFMVQGGGFEPGGLQRNDEKKTRPPIANESFNGLTNARGTLAMARTSEPDSATAQFFINVKDNAFLNRAQARDGYGYAVFGKVTDGMNVVEKIRNVPTRTVGGHENVPVDDVIIKSVRRIDKK